MVDVGPGAARNALGTPGTLPSPRSSRPPRPCAAPELRQTPDTFALLTCAPAETEPAAPREVCASSPGPGRNFPPPPHPASFPPGALPAQRRPRPGTTRNGLRLSGQRHELLQGKLRPGAGSGLPGALQSLTWPRVSEASATDRVPPTPTRSHRSWQQERARAPRRWALGGAAPPTRLARGGGERARGCSLPLATPGDTPAPPRSLSLPAAAPSRATHQSHAPRSRSALSAAPTTPGWSGWQVTPVAPPEPGRDGQRRGGARSGGAGVRTNAGRVAPSPPPLPAGCREGAQRRRGLSGSPSGVMGCQRPRAHGEGPSALICQGRALAPDSRQPEPGPRG